MIGLCVCFVNQPLWVMAYFKIKIYEAYTFRLTLKNLNILFYLSDPSL